MLKRMGGNLLLSLASFLFAAALAYLAFVVFRAQHIWKAEIASLGRGWEGRVHRFDPQLGFAPVPDSRGAHLFPIGPKIPMRYNEDGFRIPVSGQERKHPYVMALGCSFTYGDACAAEDTYPHILAGMLGGSELNAGVCSYGLTQMTLLAERLIPRFRPEYLVVEYSTLLADRSIDYFAPSYFLTLPVPYFSNDGKGGLSISPPVFRTVLFDWESSEFRDNKGFLHFLGKAGFPLLFKNDHAYVNFQWHRMTGNIPPPATNRSQVIRFVYERIAELSRQNGTRMVVVGLSFNSQPLLFPPEIENLGIPIVNAQSELLSALEKVTENSYQQAYAHFRGNPPLLVDPHPNPAAHRLIAKAVASAFLKPPAGN